MRAVIILIAILANVFNAAVAVGITLIAWGVL